MSNHNPTGASLFRVEPLERRDTPAGNVSAVLSGGQLFAYGDAADNQFSIQQNGFGDVTVVGLNGTTVNGLSSVYVGRGFVSGLQVVGGAGVDHMDVTGLYTGGPIAVYGGEAGDGITFNGVTAGSLFVDAGGGNDVVVTNGVQVFGNADLSGSVGVDTLQNRGLAAGYGAVFREFEAVA